MTKSSGIRLSLALLAVVILVVLVIANLEVDAPEADPGNRAAESSVVVPVTAPEESGEVEQNLPVETGQALSSRRLAIVGIVHDPAGRPVPGATVRALHVLRPGVAPREVATTFADEQGRFELEPVHGRVHVEAFADGRSRVRQAASPGNALVLVLASPGILSGRVLAADGDGPVGGALIEVLVGRRAIAETSTNEVGRYRFPDLPPRSYTVQVHADTFAGLQIDDVQVREDADTTRILRLDRGMRIVGLVVDAETGETIAGANLLAWPYLRRRARTDARGRFVLDGMGSRRWWIRVNAAGYVADTLIVAPGAQGAEVSATCRLHRGGAIRGVVVDASNRPVPNARVASPVHRLDDLDGGAFVTGADGAFLLSFAAGRHRVCARAYGFAAGSSEEIEVRVGGEVNGVLVMLGQGGGLEGRLTTDEGEPIAGARVSATTYDVPQDEPGPPLPMGPWDAETGPDGRFRLHHLSPGRYSVEFSADGYLDDCREAVVREGAITERFDAALFRGAVIAGRVEDGKGRPIAGRRVAAFPEVDGGGSQYADTNEDGRFRIEGLRRVPHCVTTQRAEVQNVEPGTEDLVLRLPRTGAIEGTVRLANGTPAQAFTIRAFPAEDPVRLAALREFKSKDGAFTLDDIPVGTYSVEARTSDGLLSGRISGVRVGDDGSPPKIELTLGPGGEIRTETVTPDGRAAPGGHVEIAGSESGPDLGQVVDIEYEGHSARITAVQPGRYWLRAVHDDGPAESVPVVVRAGEITNVRLVRGPKERPPK